MKARPIAVKAWQNPLVLGAGLLLIICAATISQRYTPGGRLEARLGQLEGELLQRIKIRKEIEAKVPGDIPEQVQLDRLKETLFQEIDQYERELKQWGDEIEALWDQSKGLSFEREQLFFSRREKLTRGLLAEVRLSKELKARVKALSKKLPYPGPFWPGDTIR